MEPDVYSRVVAIVASFAGVEPADITRESALVDDLDLDSLSMLAVIQSLEGEFAMEVSDADIDRLRTVGDVVDYINIQSPVTP